MDQGQQVVWITTRRLKAGSYEEFRKAWRPGTLPDGMLRAYECFSAERNEVVGISWWESSEARERYRLSDDTPLVERPPDFRDREAPR